MCSCFITGGNIDKSVLKCATAQPFTLKTAEAVCAPADAVLTMCSVQTVIPSLSNGLALGRARGCNTRSHAYPHGVRMLWQHPRCPPSEGVTTGSLRPPKSSPRLCSQEWLHTAPAPIPHGLSKTWDPKRNCRLKNEKIKGEIASSSWKNGAVGGTCTAPYRRAHRLQSPLSCVGDR